MLLSLQRTRLLHPSLRVCRPVPSIPALSRFQPRALLSTSPPKAQQPIKPELPKSDSKIELHENIYTIPNALTVSRIIACPFLGYFIVKGDFVNATWLLAYAGISDWVCCRNVMKRHKLTDGGPCCRSTATWQEDGIWEASLVAYWTQLPTRLL